MNQTLTVLQIIVSILLAGLILLQKGNASGRLFGGKDRFYRTLRGAEKKIFWATAILGALFTLLSVLNLVL